jgi:hypothetical protein
VSVLLAAGAAVDARTAGGRATPLMRAAAGGHAAVVDDLLAAGADAAAADGDGETAAHKAAAAVSRREERRASGGLPRSLAHTLFLPGPPRHCARAARRGARRGGGSRPTRAHASGSGGSSAVRWAAHFGPWS